jgi:hypothetical protein
LDFIKFVNSIAIITNGAAKQEISRLINYYLLQLSLQLRKLGYQHNVNNSVDNLKTLLM